MKRKKFKMMYAVLVASLVAAMPISTVAQTTTQQSSVRRMEYLNRGVVALETSDGIYMSWRFLGDDPDDVQFNVYKNGEKIATVINSTNYIDKIGNKSDIYMVSSVINGMESIPEGTCLPVFSQNGTATGNYIEYQLQNPGTRQSIVYRNPRGDLFNATGKYYYMPIDLAKLNTMQTVVTDYKQGVITEEEYNQKVSEFKAYTDELGLDETGGVGPTLRELGYKEDGRVPLRTDEDGTLVTRETTYNPSDITTGDLDGDGNYELIVKWDPADSRDSMISYNTSAPCIIDAYKLTDDGAQLLWRVDMGYNIRAGAHDTQMMVYDFNNDGKAEMILRTADGTTSGQVVDGKYVPSSFVGEEEAAYIEEYLLASDTEKVNRYTENVLNNYTICWEDPVYNNNSGEYGEDGYITTGAYKGKAMDQIWSKVYCYGPTNGTGNEYVTAFDGLTGEIIDTVPYEFAITEDMWGINAFCRRSAGCSGKILESDALHLAENPEYVPQSFWSDISNDIGNNYMMFGDSSGNRSGRFLASVALLDGQTPSAVISRGYYGRTTLVAYQLIEGKLVLDSTFNSSEYENHEDYECRGNHNLSVGDVDNDGFDEILYGSIAFEKKDIDSDEIDVKYVVGVALPEGDAPAASVDLMPIIREAYNEDGTLKDNYKFTYLWHGDAIHLFPKDQSNELMVFTPHEDSGDAARGWALSMHAHNAETGEIEVAAYKAGDQGRGAAGNVDPRYATTAKVWANMAADATTGEKIDLGKGYSSNFTIYWTDSLVRQLFDGQNNPTVKSMDTSGIWNTVMTFTDTSTTNGTKANPLIQADLFGDWREEIVTRVTSTNDVIRIYTTNIPTEYKIRTLMHDPMYRLAIAWQNVCYNQPPHASFFMGYEQDGTPIISTSKRTDIEIVKPGMEIQIEQVEDQTIEIGGKLNLPSTLKVLDIDGIEKELPVEWNVDNVNINEVGSYIVEGVLEGIEQKIKVTVNVIENGIKTSINMPSEVKSGDTFSVVVDLTTDEVDIYSQSLTIAYDKSCLTLVEQEAIAPTLIIDTKELDEGIQILTATEGGKIAEEGIIKLTFQANNYEERKQTTIEVKDVQLGKINIDNGTSSLVVAAGIKANLIIEPIQSGDIVDRYVLENLIREAEELYNMSEVGTAEGQYPQSAINALKVVIDEANGIVATSQSQSEIDAMVSNLTNSIINFKKSQIQASEKDKEDINQDGKVDIADIALVAYYYRSTSTGSNWEYAKIADINDDKEINILDLVLVAKKVLGK